MAKQFTLSLLVLLLVSLACLPAEGRTRPAATPSAASQPAVDDAQDDAHKNSQGGLRYSIQVRKFEDESTYPFTPPQEWYFLFRSLPAGDNDHGLPAALKSMLTDALQKSGRCIVIAENDMRNESLHEQDFANSDMAQHGNKTPHKGQMTPAQLLVRGRITNIQNEVSGGNGGFRIGNIDLSGKNSKAQIDFAIEVVNSQTGMIVASQQVTGTAKSSRVGGSISRLLGSNSNIHYEGFKNDNFGKACQNAINEAVVFIVDQLDDVQWLGSVVSVDAAKGEFIVNRGEREGVEIGMIFQVGAGEELTDPDTGETLEWSLNRVGLLEVVKVHPKTAYCRRIDGKAKIERGYLVTPTRDSETFSNQPNQSGN